MACDWEMKMMVFVKFMQRGVVPFGFPSVSVESNIMIIVLENKLQKSLIILFGIIKTSMKMCSS